MNENEAIEKLLAYLECESRRAKIVSCNESCDDCELCYMQGTVSEHIASVETAIKALEEIQKYREIEKDLKERYHSNVDIPLLMQHFIETVFKGEKHEGFCILTNEDKEAWEEYKAIGTPEECRAAMEKQTAKKPTPINYEKYANLVDNAIFLRGAYWCPHCKHVVKSGTFCRDCGQKLDWSTDTVTDQEDTEARR